MGPWSILACRIEEAGRVKKELMDDLAAETTLMDISESTDRWIEMIVLEMS